MNPILVLTYFSYKDALLQTYTLPYAKIIARVSKRRVYIVCLEQAQLFTSIQERIQINLELDDENIEIIFFDYYRFGVKQVLAWGLYIFKLLYIIFNERIEFLHGWCTTGGSVAYLLSKISTRTLILDSYEPHAELMFETNVWTKQSLAFKILFKLEGLQVKRAKKIIAVVSKMTDYSSIKHQFEIDKDSFFVKPACVDLDKFYVRDKKNILVDELKLNDKIVCVYAGKIGGIYLENELFDFIRQCYLHWKQEFMMLLLTNTPVQIVENQLNRIGVPSKTVVQKFVFHEEIPEYMALGDFAVNFMKPVPTRRFSAPIKDGEYWATGLPVVITSNISDDSDIIEENNAGYVLKSLTDEEYNRAIAKIDDLLKEDIGLLKKRIRALACKYRNFDIAEKVYKQIYSLPDTVN